MISKITKLQTDLDSAKEELTRQTEKATEVKKAHDTAMKKQKAKVRSYSSSFPET